LVVHGAVGAGVVKVEEEDPFSVVMAAGLFLRSDARMSGWLVLSHGMQWVSKSGLYSQYSGGIPQASQ